MNRCSVSVLAIIIFLVAGNCVTGQDSAPLDEPAPSNLSPADIKRLAQDLSADSYQEREQATDALIQAGPIVIEPLLELWPDSNLECQYRISRVLQSIVPEIDYDQHAGHLEALMKMRSAEDKKLAAIAVQLIGAEPEPELAKELKVAIDRVLSGEKTAVPVSKELFTKLQSSEAFQVVRRQPLRQQDPNSPWRTIQDSEAHQEILIYRIKWFNGKWSGWLLSGVNDINKQLNRQHWNCFYDHQHEFIEIRTKVGNLSKRSDYLKLEEANNADAIDQDK